MTITSKSQLQVHKQSSKPEIDILNKLKGLGTSRVKYGLSINNAPPKNYAILTFVCISTGGGG